MSNDIEKTILTTKTHPGIFIPAIIIFTIGLIPIIVYAISRSETFLIMWSIPTALCLWLAIKESLKALIQFTTTKVTITNRRILAKTGLLEKYSIEIPLPKVESIRIRQNILEEIMDFGTITITGTGGTKATLRSIKELNKVKTKINQIIEHFNQVTKTPEEPR